MKLLTQKENEQYCILYCAAMLLDLDIETIINYIGTDGLEKWWPNYPAPRCYRGIHIQEIQDLFIGYGKALVLIEKYPTVAPCSDERVSKPIYDIERCEMRFFSRLIGHKAILVYQSHAKALDSDGQVYDPNGQILQISPRESSLCREAWLVGTL